MTIETISVRPAGVPSRPRVHCQAVGAPPVTTMSGIRAVLFDVDGVIADTAVLHAAAWRRLAVEVGLGFDDRLADAVRGVTREESLDIVLGDRRLSRRRRTEWMDRKNRYYVEALGQLAERDLLPGVMTLMDDLSRLGIRIAAVSASRNAGTVLEKLAVTDRFEVVIDGQAAGPGTGASNRYLAAAAAMGVGATQCAVIEDSAAGIEAATAARMKVVGIGTPVRMAGADLVFESLSGVRGDMLIRWLSPGG
jgi:kojibiose phosphorylase